jgi:CheY-like chemotaxis protein
VDDLLEVSRITRGKIELRKERVELAAVVRGAVETSRPLIEANHHQLAIALPAEPVILHADAVRLAQVLTNLLNNAAKYTDPGGQIWLSARRQGDQVIGSVRDTGVGIAPEKLQHVFELFMQVDRTSARAQGGLGIGLTLAKTLIEMHGGTIEAHSEGPGKGSEFIFRFPIAEQRPLAGRAPHVEVASAPLLAPRRILVVDDNRDSADSLGALLKFLGADVRVVYNGTTALAAVQEFQPAVILLDIGMPGMDGCEVARRIREQPELQHLTLIALTGWGQEADRQGTKAAGFNYHLMKPADIGALEAVLTSLDRAN